MIYKKHHTLKPCLLIVLLLLCSGCSTMITKTSSPAHIGNSYSGVENAMENWRCIGQRSQMFFPMILITWPILALDTITSALGDTILLPLDMAQADQDSPEIRLCDDNPYFTSAKLY